MRLRSSLVQQGIFVIVFPLVCQIFVVVGLTGYLSQIRDQQLQTAHARDMISMSYTILLDTITGIFEAHANSDQEGLVGVESTNQQLDIISKDIAILNEKASGNPVELRHAASVDSAARGLIETMKWAAQQQSLGIHNWKRVNDKCYDAVNEGSRNMIDALEALVDAMRPAAAQKSNRASQTGVELLFAVALVNFALALVLGLVYASRIVGSLKSVEKNRALLSQRKTLLPIESEYDEIIELDLAMQSANASLASALEAGSQMIKTAGNLICSLDGDLLFAQANPAAKNILGIEPELLVGKSVREFIDSSAVDMLREAQAKSQESTMQTELSRQDGSVIHTHWSLNPDQASGILFCVVQDTTDKKRREGLRQRFLDAVRVSLRTPIAAISDALQQVLSNPALAEDSQTVQSRVRTDLQRAARSARQCILLIDVLLDSQSAETGSITIETRKASIGGIVAESIEHVRAIAERKHVVIELESNDAIVECDQLKIIQTTINFLSNAIKFSPEGGKIFVGIEANQNHVEVSVTDQGPGIADEHRESIFKPFVQVPGEKAKEGTGLGLAICKQIVEAHGGEIGVSPSRRGESGSTFWYRLPLE